MGPEGFPRDFLWGVATSAQQIEGAAAEDGRGESIWDHYARQPGAISDGSNPLVACDHYHRWREDLALMGELGVNAYRFSIAWPRVLPAGTGAVNARGLDFYDALVDALLARGITPFLTLNHWDVPQPLQDCGGWSERAMVDAFVAYTEAVAARLGDRVHHWVTHNEPWCVAQLGWEQGVHAPGAKDPAAALRVAHHLLLGHGRALEVLRRDVPKAAAGIVLIQMAVQPASDTAADRDAARQVDGAFNRWYLEPLYRGAYPADVIADRVRLGHLSAPELDFVQPGDLACIAGRTDFLGINYYSRGVVRAGANGAPESVKMAPAHELTDMGWEVYAPGLHDVLVRLHRDYAPQRLYVTENGGAFPDGADPQDCFHDARRIDYLRTHVASLQRALADGVPLAGYFVWSLLDNWEWGQGYTMRFGLHHVDYATQQRTPRASARWYHDLITRGVIETAEPTQLTRRTP